MTTCPECQAEEDPFGSLVGRRDTRDLCPKHRAQANARGWKEATVALLIVLAVVIALAVGLL